MAKRQEVILAELRRHFGELVGLDLTSANPEASFIELGFDSLCLTQAAAVVKRNFGTKITFRQLNGDLDSLGAVARHIDASLPEEKDEGPAPALSGPPGRAEIRSGVRVMTP